MTHISVNDLKTKGIAAFDWALSGGSEVIVSVRGKDRFVATSMAHYQHFRECELDAALAETRTDLAAGRVVQDSPEAPLARLVPL